MSKQEFRFDLSNKKGCSINSFVIRETNGKDEEMAARSAKAKGGAITVFEELVRLSIVKVDDEPVQMPLAAYDEWNSKTRSYILKAFQAVNGMEDDVNDFLASGLPSL